MCREMNCGDAVTVSGSFGQGEDVRGYRISCNGRERSLTECTLREYVRTINDRVEETSVKCSGLFLHILLRILLKSHLFEKGILISFLKRG